MESDPLLEFTALHADCGGLEIVFDEITREIGAVCTCGAVVSVSAEENPESLVNLANIAQAITRSGASAEDVTLLGNEHVAPDAVRRVLEEHPGLRAVLERFFLEHLGKLPRH
jgi:hypothetical protein